MYAQKAKDFVVGTDVLDGPDARKQHSRYVRANSLF